MDHSLHWHLWHTFPTSHKKRAFPLTCTSTTTAHFEREGYGGEVVFAMAIMGKELKNGIGVILLAFGGLLVII